MKKHALRVLGLALALIAAGCTNPFNEGLSAPPAGKGAVTVSVGPGARTLLPDVAALYYTLAFTSGEKTASGVISSGASGSFQLDAGTWSLVVTGYLNAEASTNGANAVAGGNAGGIVVSAGQTTPATVELSALIGAGQGTLSYDIAFPSAVTVAVLTARPVSGEPVTVNLLENQVDQSIETDGGVTTVEGTRSLPVGYHEVSVYLYDASLGRLMKWDVAHIYKGLITTLVGNFGPGNFSAGSDVAALNAALGAAQAARADIGSLNAVAEEVTALDAAIAAAQTALADTATQQEVDAATAALTTATAAFTAAKTAAKTAANAAAADSFKTTHAVALALTVDNVAIANKEAVNAALAAYTGLSEAVKALLSGEKNKLDGLLAKIADMEAAANASTQDLTAAATYRSAYSAALALSVDTVAISNKDAVNAALAAYNALSATVKALLNSEKAKLDSLLAKIVALEAAESDSAQDLAAAATYRSAHTAALALTVDTVQTSDRAAVNAALSAYNSLSAEAKELLSDEKAKLDSLLAKIADLEAAENASAEHHAAAEAFKTTHATVLALTASTVQISNKAAVNDALSAYNGLPQAVKDLVGSEKALLDVLLAKVADLEAAANASAQDLTAAATYRSDYGAALALSVDTVAISNKDAVNAALAAYNALSQAVKGLVSSEKTRLDSLKAKIDRLGAGSVTVSFTGLPEDETINLSGAGNTLSWKADTTINLTVPAGFDSYAWDVDGKTVAGATNTLSLHARTYAMGTHTVTVKVTNAAGKTYAKWARFGIGE
jgi:hypothetical protein